MKEYAVDLRDDQKKIYSHHIQKLGGENPEGKKIGLNNYFMELDRKPFFGIMGELHFSRLRAEDWEDEITKMKMCGINIIATYIFWIFHEEEKGVFEWTGNKDIRRFLELCKKHGMYVVLRIGPFGHGEVRNGALPDWLYGGPFEVRSNDAGYLFYVKRLYSEIGKQTEGLMYKNGGPVIGVQLENEYMHSAAAWEFTVTTGNEWISPGRDRDDHILRLKEIAIEAGLDTPIYTCTGWGNASAPEGEVLALWGGYAYRPWLFFDDMEEHPATEEYIFQDYHNNNSQSYNYDPKYAPEDYPYACCEMGGGMQVTYGYRFTVPPESIDAMAIIKIAGGCNMLGYYMFCGGTNPDSKGNVTMNEYIWPKKSYDYQAPVGEFGQVRESYMRLKRIHYFLSRYEQSLCPMKTILPEGAANISPHDTGTLRFGIRTKDGSGFIFLNNFQDHLEMKEHNDVYLKLQLEKELLRIPGEEGFTLLAGNSCILPFNLDIEGVLLKYSTTQLITNISANGESYYFFFEPEGMEAEYCFNSNGISLEKQVSFDIQRKHGTLIVKINNEESRAFSIYNPAGKKINIVTLTHRQSLNFWKANIMGAERAVITDAALMSDENGLRLEWVGNHQISFQVFPDFEGTMVVNGEELVKIGQNRIFSAYGIPQKDTLINMDITNISKSRAVVKLEKDNFKGLKNIILNVNYTGDVGYALIDGRLIHDNYCNNAVWEIGLKGFAEEMHIMGMNIYISPLKKGSRVSSDSPMAARSEVFDEAIAEIESIKAEPVFEVLIEKKR
ncbi:MAG: glycosyl hydrolase family 35 [Eubacterium sp.]|nr:glycosyl hydrolase family 35 [Eubacterium sp.]